MDSLQRKKIEYTGEVILKTEERIRELEKRIAKAVELGAHKKKKKHPWRVKYRQLKSDLKTQKDWLIEYQQAYKDMTGKDFIVDYAKKTIFRPLT